MKVKRISYCWKLSLLCCYFVAFVGAIVTCVTMGKSTQQFEGRCPLYTKSNFSLSTKHSATNPNETETVIQNGGTSKVWQDRYTCDFATYIPVAASAYGFIAAYFILMCDRAIILVRNDGSSSRNRMDGLFYPLLILSILFSALMIVASVWIQNGTQIFCNSILEALAPLRCVDAQYYTWEDFPLSDVFYNVLLTGMITSWISTSAFLFSVLILLLRCALGVDLGTKPAVKIIKKSIAPRKKPKTNNAAEMEKPLLDESDDKSTPTTIKTEAEPLPGTSSEPHFMHSVTDHG